jgi:hypothetical protein
MDCINGWTASAWSKRLSARQTFGQSGADCLTILCRNHNGARVAETMELDDNRRVVRSYACYSPPV